ncbi:MAG: hypothetical protein M0Q26_13495 [Chitinophagaceae bacterium]|nr:hypothetical protein [Chitinophagaceae bacterium]
MKNYRIVQILMQFSIFLVTLLSFNCFSQVNVFNGHKTEFTLLDIETSPKEGDSILNYFIKLSQSDFRLVYEKGGRKEDILLTKIYPFLIKQLEILVTETKDAPVVQIVVDIEMTAHPIFKKIQTFGQKKPISGDEINVIWNEIDALPISKEKVWLILWFLRINMLLDKSLYDVTAICNKARLEADKINGLYERGEAYVYIGEFAKQYQIPEAAMSVYYFAKRDFYFSNKDSIVTQNAQGIVCEKIADLFSSASIPSMIKQNKYYASAYHYYAASRDSAGLYRVFSNYISNRAYLLTDLGYYNVDTALRHLQQAILLKYLSMWFLKQKQHTQPGDFTYLTSIATMLRSENKHVAALSYNLYALASAYLNANINDIYDGIYSAAFTYSVLKKEQQAMTLLNIAIALALKTNNRFEYYRAISYKGDAFYNLNKYDSALMCANTLLYNVTYDNQFNIAQYSRSRNNALHLKSKIFKVLNKKDSASYYELESAMSVNRKTEEFSSLLEAESGAMTLWIDNTKDLEVALEKRSKENISNQNMGLIFFTAVLIILIIMVIIFRKRDKDKSNKLLEFRTQLLQSANSDLTLRSAIQNHNLGNHYSKIKILLRSHRIDKVDRAVKYCEKTSTYFSQFYMLLLDDKPSLGKELRNFKLFVETEKIYDNKNIEIQDAFEGIQPDSISFLTGIFAPLYENSSKAFTETENPRFSISISKEDKIVCCKVSDNGEGVSNIELLVADKHFLSMLRDRVYMSFTMKGVIFNPDDVFKIKSSAVTGTEIEFKLPYEEI